MDSATGAQSSSTRAASGDGWRSRRAAQHGAMGNFGSGEGVHASKQHQYKRYSG
jgi:hypothetical protein